MNDTIFKAAALIIPMIIAIVFHEVAHGWTAKLLGDDTAEKQGRLTLNPIKHIDLFGTIILPGILRLAGMPVFGFAKPVPVDKWRLRNPKRDMMLVAAAGPLSNLIMGLIGAVMLGFYSPPEVVNASSIEEFRVLFAAHGPVSEFVGLSLLFFILLNVSLAIFNLLPIPPFDGGHIVEGLLPDSLAQRYGQLHRYALLVMILLLVVLPMAIPSLNVLNWLVGPPVDYLIGHYMNVVDAISTR